MNSFPDSFKCIWCGHDLFIANKLSVFPICTQLSSIFLPSIALPTDNHSFHSFVPSVCSHCLSPQVTSNSPLPIHSFSNPSIQYNEPDQHLEALSGLLAPIAADKSVRCYSYKDLPLARLLNSEYTADTSALKDSKFTSQRGPTFHLARRYIEHFTCHESFHTFLSSIIPGDFLYLEILDFSQQLNPLFLWDERHLYPSRTFLLSFFSELGFSLIHQQTNDFGEPFHCLVFKRNTSRSLFDPFTKLRENHPIDIYQLYHELIHAASDLTSGSTSLAFYGVSHKALTLATTCLCLNPEIRINLIDSSPAKVGKFWSNLMITDFDSKLVSMSSKHIFSFGGANALNLISQLPQSALTISLPALFS